MNTTFQHRIISLKVDILWYEIKKDKQKYIVGVIYRNLRTCINEFNEKLESTLTKIISDNKITDCDISITSDINIDFICYDIDNKTEEYLNTMLRNAFMPSGILPTRLSSKACTLLDHIFYYSKTFRNKFFSGNLYVDITDHLANYLILGPKKTKNDRKNVRIFSEKNNNKFKEVLSLINWKQEIKNKSVNEAMEFFYHNLTKAHNKSFPIVKLSRKRANDKPWITSDLKTSVKKKHLLYKKYLQNRSDENKLEYTTYNNNLRTIIRKQKLNTIKGSLMKKKTV